jgi:hypothetical protein
MFSTFSARIRSRWMIMRNRRVTTRSDDDESCDEEDEDNKDWDDYNVDEKSTIHMDHNTTLHRVMFASVEMSK